MVFHDVNNDRIFNGVDSTTQETRDWNDLNLGSFHMESGYRGTYVSSKTEDLSGNMFHNDAIAKSHQRTVDEIHIPRRI